MNVCKIAVVMALIAILGIGVASAQTGFVWDSIKPAKAPSGVKALVMGKELTYYPLEKGKEIVITVTGPTRLKVLSRIEFGEEKSGEKSYYLRYELDGKGNTKFRRVATASATAVLAEKRAIHLGTAQNVYIKVPDGKHTYRFYVGSKSTYRLFCRFYERSAAVETESDNIALTPARFTTVIPIIVKEDEASYFRIGSQDSVELSVIGPTTIKVLSRLEHNPAMFANEKFRIRVFEDTIEKQTYPLRSAPSEVAEYGYVTDTVLGKGAKFFIEVPKGKHLYRFEVIDNGRNALLRFFIPQKDLNNNL
ncbi:hypothetical protein KJ564_12720 [bacterium]|nr:hypothetical protein [bacterium]